MSRSHGDADEAASIPTNIDSIDFALDWYSIISLEDEPKLGPESSLKEITSSYRRKARDLHPDKNPDPNAAIAFHQLKDVFAWLSNADLRSNYDARLVAAARKQAKDAALDSVIGTMKRDLERREAEAIEERLQKKIRDREAALNPRGAMTEEERIRKENEQLFKSMGLATTPTPSKLSHDHINLSNIRATAPASTSSSFSSHSHPYTSSMDADDRPSKLRRTHLNDSNVHAGFGSVHPSLDESIGDEATRTLILRWSKAIAANPSNPSHPIELASSSLTAFFQTYAPIEHVFLRLEKRKAMIVFASRDGSIVGEMARQKLKSTDGWELKRLDATSSTPSHTSMASSSNGTSTVKNDMPIDLTQESSALPHIPTSSASNLPSSTSTPVEPHSVPMPSTTSTSTSTSPSIPSTSTATDTGTPMTAAQRMAAMAQASKLKRQAAAAKAATQINC